MNRRVRIYNSEDTAATIIGFSASCGVGGSDHEGLYQQNRMARFFEGLGRSAVKIDVSPEHSVSYSHYEIKPPLMDEHIKTFAALCIGAGGFENLVDNKFGAESVIVYDNRHILPQGPFDRQQGTLVAWG